MATVREEDRKAWLAERRTGLGGSDIAKILGLSKWGSGVDVYLDKKGLKEETPENEAMRLGTFLEPFVADRFAEETGLKCIDYRPTIHRDECFVGDLDRIVVEHDQDAQAMLARLREGDLSCVESILECKTATRMDDWQDEFGNDVVPEYYRSQVMWYMGLIPSCKRCYVAVYFTGLTKAFKYMVIERNEELIAKLQKFAKDWWDLHIIQGVMPEPRSEEDVVALYPRSVEASKYDVAAEGEDGKKTLQELTEYRTLMAKLDEVADPIEKRLKALKASLTATLKDREMLVSGDTILATYKTDHDTVKDITDWQGLALSLGATAELIDSFTKKGVVTRKGARKFLLKKEKSADADKGAKPRRKTEKKAA